MTLYTAYLNNTGRPIHKMMHYIPIYERHFGFMVGRPGVFLEIGAGNGGSSQLWKRWFGPLTHIVTIDINATAKQYEDEQVSVRIGDQSDPSFLRSVIEEFGTINAVLDDGSHRMPHVLASMDFLYPRIASNGIYMIEDVHTAYWADWGGGPGAEATIVSRFKTAVDKLNADHCRDGTIEHDEFSRNTWSISAYDSVLVFEKARYINKKNDMVGDQSKRAMY